MSNTKCFVIKKLCVAMLATLSIASHVQASGLDDALNDVFNGMSNTTQPGVYETQRRGVLAGGGTVARTKVMDMNFLSFTPPSFKAGCGGIDIYLGSFSYINKEQFIQFLRSIAANALGYAFHVALAGTCPICITTINKLQDSIQSMNNRMGSSCELAQGIVNDTFGSFNKANQTNASISATVSGLGDDFLSIWGEQDGKSATEKLQTNAPDKAKDFIGNVIWRGMKDGDIATWMISGKADDELLETMMSLTGTVVFGELKDTGNGKSQEFKQFPAVVSLKEFVEGSESLTRYQCDTTTNEGCLNPIQKKGEKIEGLITRINSVLLGKGDSVGVIAKFANPNQENTTLTNEEKNIMAMLSISGGTVLRNLAINSESAARLAAHELVRPMAVELGYSLGLEFLRSMEVAMIKNKQDGHKKPMEKLIRDRRTELENEYLTLINQYGTVATSLQRVESIAKLVQRLEVAYPGINRPRNTNTH